MVIKVGALMEVLPKSNIPLILLVLLITAPHFTGCGPSVSKLKEDFNRDFNTLRGVQADHTASLEELQEQVRRMVGQIEELQHRVLGKTAELEKKLRRFSSRVPPPEGVPENLLNRDEELIARNKGEAAELFLQGLQQVRGGEFDRAAITFETFVQANPDTAFSDNALFWRGISLEKRGDYGGAIKAYNEVFVRYPAEDRVPYSLLRLGETFLKIGSGTEAKDTLRKVVDDYPGSEAARQAKSRLKELKIKRRRR